MKILKYLLSLQKVSANYGNFEVSNVLCVRMTNCSFQIFVFSNSFLLDCLLFCCTITDVAFDFRVEFAVPYH